jgi:predicted molibdopterin-dependent oxidoreductase YjgC
MITIDGQTFSFSPGETILDVASRNGIFIPTLCYLKGASPTGACRICVVEVEGARNLVAACTTPAGIDMVVSTESPRVVKARRLNLELLLASGYHNCLVQDMDADTWTDLQLKGLDRDEHKDICPAYGECRLQALAIKYGVKTGRFEPKETPYAFENVNPFIARDFSRCILCGRCVQACNEIQVNNAISYGYRGSESKIVASGDRALKDSDCVFCGECIQACPVGALIPANGVHKGHLSTEEKKIRTTCGYCGVGCQLNLHIYDNKVVRVTGVEDLGPNYGSLCVKGRFGHDFITHPERLKTPLIKKNGQFTEASWDEALDFVAKGLSKIKETSGPDSIMVLSSARITNEENYLAQKFARAVIKTNNVDHCARL